MRFVYDLTVPANTLESAPATLVKPLVMGRITRVQVRFLRGCHNQVSVVMREALTKIVPVADSDTMIGDGQIFDVPMAFKLTDTAPKITFEGWSPGTTYEHKITFFIDLQPESGDERGVLEQLFFAAAQIEGF